MVGVRVAGLDHVVLRVADTERSLAWYCGELGLAPERADAWRRGEVPFPSVRIDDHTLLDLLPLPRVDGGGGNDRTGGHRNMDHLCLVVDPADVDWVLASGRFEVVDGPARRFGARGEGVSVYVTDPDANVVELRHYG